MEIDLSSLLRYLQPKCGHKYLPPTCFPHYPLKIPGLKLLLDLICREVTQELFRYSQQMFDTAIGVVNAKAERTWLELRLDMDRTLP